MAEAKKKSADAEATVLTVPAGYPEDEVGQDAQSSLPTISVSKSDMPDAEPTHAGPEKLGVPSDVFDPNAALRNKLGYGPGLQDSEAKNPAVWVDGDSEEAREAAAKAEVQAAQRVLDRAKARAEKIRKGEPLDNEAGNVRG